MVNNRIRLWVHTLLYCFILALIGCHHHPYMQSRDKESVKTVAKSTQAKGSGRLEQTTQTTGVSLRSFVIMLAFLSQVTSGVVGLTLHGSIIAPGCRILSVNDYQQLPYTFPLKLSPSFDDGNFRAFLEKLSDKAYPDYVRSACCHLFSEADIDVTTFCTTEQEDRHTFSQCSEHCAKELDSALKQVPHVSHPSDQRPITHYAERPNDFRRNGNRVKENQNGALEVYPNKALIHYTNNSEYFSAFIEKVDVYGSNEHGHKTTQRQARFRSPQDLFNSILSIDNRSERIIQLQEAGKKILGSSMLRQWCYMPGKQDPARSWISAGLEFSYVAKYEAARQGTKKFFDDRLSYKPRIHRTTRDTQYMENLESVQRHGTTIKSIHTQKKIAQKIGMRPKRHMDRKQQKHGIS